MFGTYCRLGVPVWSTDREVIRAARRLLGGDGAGGRAPRRAPCLLRQMLEFHHCEQELRCASTGF